MPRPRAFRRSNGTDEQEKEEKEALRKSVVWEEDKQLAANTDWTQFDPTLQVGVTDPLGFFDPLGFAKKGEQEEFRRLRASEIKHGRVSMLAAIGAVAQHFYQVPGFERSRNTLEGQVESAFKFPGVWFPFFFIPFTLWMELAVWWQSEDREPGDFGDPLGFNQYTTDMRNREINNGRFAMFAVVGILAAQVYSGKDAAQQLGFAM